LKEVQEKHHFTNVPPFFDEIRDFTNSSWISKWILQDTSMVFALTSSKTYQLACNMASQSRHFKEDTEKHHFKNVASLFDEIRSYSNSSWISKWNIQDTHMVFAVTLSKIVQLACNRCSQPW
jgi:hypothetical protein